jgi:cephalosporin hydroxylase
VNGVREFHRAYYDSNVWRGPTQWLGVPAQKFPTDLWIYQEILFECRPDIIIETGTYWGGSALFLATICEAIGTGQIVSIDISHENLYPIQSARVSFIQAPSADPSTLELVRQAIKPTDTVMVILDSDHQKSHVLAELDAYASFVTPGQYLIVEDTNINGNPVLPEFGPGPREALGEWLPKHSEFKVDRSREKFGLTTNEGGYLRRS